MPTSQRLARTLPLAAALLIASATAHALARTKEPQSKETQSKEPRPAKESQAKETTPKVFCDTARAVSLVETQLSESKMFEAVERRLSVMTRAADLLWPYERDAAREIFQQAYDLAVKDFREHENDAPPQGMGSTYVVVPRVDQRFVVMTAIARRDPAWARQLAEGVAEEKRREAEQSSNATAANARRDKSDGARETLDLAQSLLPVDRASSLALARGSFRQPASYALIFFLFKLAEADRAAADALFADALNAYGGRAAADLAYLSVYAFALNRESGPVPLAVYYQPPKGFAPNARHGAMLVEALFRQVEKAFRSSEAPPPEEDYLTEQANLLVMLTTLEPLIARLNPSMLERALALKGTATAAASAQSRERAEDFARMLRDAESDAAFDRTVEQVERERDPAKRDYYVANLIMSAHNAEDLARAETFLDKVSDASLREKLASYLYFVWAQQALKDGQLDDATRLSKKVSELDYRALLSLEIAGAALKKMNDRARAAELLDAVASEAQKAPDTPSKARALLGVAHLYTGFDATRASQVLRAAVKVVNLLPDPDFPSETIGRELGNSVFTMYAIYNVPGMRLDNAFRELGALDFESALSAATDLSDKHQRALAVLGLASKCLEDSAAKPGPKPAPKKKQNREQ
ncbi:MAG TPA: hypothetical protein VKB12_18385 [Pyrinomonadaceae bacterium]|nr:hypothetical protein [Pyrinomonadaceae bacterium]